VVINENTITKHTKNLKMELSFLYFCYHRLNDYHHYQERAKAEQLAYQVGNRQFQNFL